jgi:siroheme synthase-like protein
MRVLVIGGGKVALRKCIHFDGADITVIAENIIPEIESIAGSVIKKRTSSSEVSELMKGFDITVAATDDPVLNSEIRDEALRRDLYINSAHGGGNVVIPSVLRRNGYLVSVSSAGKLPAFPPYLVEELNTFLDGRFDIMFDILYESRKMCAGKGTQPQRADFLRRVSHDPEIDKYARAGDLASAVERARTLWVQ